MGARLDKVVQDLRAKYGPTSVIRLLDEGSEFCHLYMLRNKINFKVYIGKTRRGEAERFRQHVNTALSGKGFRVHAAIRKYGVDNFEVIHLGSATSTQNIDRFEKYCIDVFNACDREYGYNLTLGGDGGKLSEDTKKKMSIKATGRKLDEATKHKIRLVHLGVKRSPEICARLSASRKGIKHPRHKVSMKKVWERPEHRDKCRQAMLVSWQNPEIRAKRSAAMKKAWEIRRANGDKGSNREDQQTVR